MPPVWFPCSNTLNRQTPVGPSLSAAPFKPLEGVYGTRTCNPLLVRGVRGPKIGLSDSQVTEKTRTVILKSPFAGDDHQIPGGIPS